MPTSSLLIEQAHVYGADLALLDAHERVTLTVAAGEVVYQAGVNA